MESKRGMLHWSGAPQWVCHQMGWWACVIWMGWLGPAIMFAFILLHLWCERVEWREELRLVWVSAFVGLVVDNSLAAVGAVSYVGDPVIGWMPLWLLAIWAGFGATLRHSQSILVQGPRAAFLTGALGGPLAYLGGVRLERLSVDGVQGFVWVGLVWTGAMFTLWRVAQPTARKD